MVSACKTQSRSRYLPNVFRLLTVGEVFCWAVPRLISTEKYMSVELGLINFVFH